MTTQPNDEQIDDINVPKLSDLFGTWKRIKGSIGYKNSNGVVDSIGENPVDAGTRYITFNDSFYIMFGFHTNYNCRFPQTPYRYSLNFDTLYIPAIDQADAASWEAQGYEYNNVRTIKIQNSLLIISNEMKIMNQDRNLSPYIYIDEYELSSEIDSSGWPINICR